MRNGAVAFERDKTTILDRFSPFIFTERMNYGTAFGLEGQLAFYKAEAALGRMSNIILMTQSISFARTWMKV